MLALLAWFLVLFVLRGTERLAGLAIAVLLVLVAWAFHREWQQAEGRAQGELQEAREAIQEAEASVNEALARVEDDTLERELCQRQVLAGGEKQPGL